MQEALYVLPFIMENTESGTCVQVKKDSSPLALTTFADTVCPGSKPYSSPLDCAKQPVADMDIANAEIAIVFIMDGCLSIFI